MVVVSDNTFTEYRTLENIVQGGREQRNNFGTPPSPRTRSKRVRKYRKSVGYYGRIII